MADQHASQRVSGLARALGLLALLAGIVAMHAGVFVVGSADTDAAMPGHNAAAMSAAIPGTVSEHSALSEHTAGIMPAANALPVATNGASSAGETHCAGADCGGGHGGMHGCVFILVALAIALALVLLYRIGGGTPGTGRAPIRLRRPRRIRPPPWTVLSLAELSILRI